MEEIRQTRIELETERIRNAILSSVSHDLRLPLDSIIGVASTMVETGPDVSTVHHEQLVATIYEESSRLN